MKLLGNRVLLKPLPQTEQSEGGVWYDMTRRDDRTQWIVEAVGPGRRIRCGIILPPEPRVGDKCFCNPGHGCIHTFEDGRMIVEATQVQMVWV